MKVYVINENKREIILKESLSNKLNQNKYYSFNEFKNKLLLNYDERAILDVMNSLSVKAKVAKTMLKYIPFIDKDKYQSNKLNKLVKIKKELIDKNLLTGSSLFKAFLKDKEVIFDKNIVNNEVNKVKSLVNSIGISENSSTYQHVINEFNNVFDEVNYVVERIASLIKQGIDINKIKLVNLNDEYRESFKKIFKLYKIPFLLNDDLKINSNPLVQEFISNYDNKPWESLEDNEVSEYLVKIINKYVLIGDYNLVKELVIDDINNTSFKKKNITKAIRESDLLTESFNNDEYVFLVGFIQGSVPSISKDELYLNDLELSELSLSTSLEMNNYKKEVYIDVIRKIENLDITYSKFTSEGEVYISNLNEVLAYEVNKPYLTEFSHSYEFNRYYLSKLLDNFNKYGIYDERINILYDSFRDTKFSSYNNQFKGVSKNLLLNYLNGTYNLSYSSMDTFYHCSFRYYIDNILKLGEFESTFAMQIGNIFHGVLESYFDNPDKFLELWNEQVNKYMENPNKKELFFLDKLKKELEFIIEEIKNHDNFSSLDQVLYEERMEVLFDGEFKVNFKGFIDKLKYQESDLGTVVAIIDYKTGNPKLNLNNSVYGIDMQLPVYMYLARNSKTLSNIKIAGIYLQKIIHSQIKSDYKTLLNTQKKSNLLLQGFSNENISILEKFDSSYNDSLVVKSLKTSSKGFYAYSKILNDKAIDDLIMIVEDKIKKAILKINNGEFLINPKQIGKDNVGCLFCEYRDLCYRKEEDIIKLKEYKKLEFLGGDEDE